MEAAELLLQKNDLSYSSLYGIKPDGSGGINDQLLSAGKRRLLDSQSRVISEIDEATGDIVRTRFSDGALGPISSLVHDSASPAVDDVIGKFAFKMRNSAGTLFTGVELRALAKNVTAGAEEVWFEAGIMKAGTFVPSGLSLRVVGGEMKLYIDGAELSGGGSAFSGARVYRTTDQSIATSTFTPINFTSERYDTDTYHDNATNNTRLTAPSDGYYRVTLGVTFANNSTGFRLVYIDVDGTTTISRTSNAAFSSSFSTPPLSTEIFLNSGQYVEAVVWQSSGGNLNVLALGNYTPEFSISRIGS